jgi:hypothetical protein
MLRMHLSRFAIAIVLAVLVGAVRGKFRQRLTVACVLTYHGRSRITDWTTFGKRRVKERWFDQGARVTRQWGISRQPARHFNPSRQRRGLDELPGLLHRASGGTDRRGARRRRRLLLLPGLARLPPERRSLGLPSGLPRMRRAPSNPTWHTRTVRGSTISLVWRLPRQRASSGCAAYGFDSRRITTPPVPGGRRRGRSAGRRPSIRYCRPHGDERRAVPRLCGTARQILEGRHPWRLVWPRLVRLAIGARSTSGTKVPPKNRIPGVRSDFLEHSLRGRIGQFPNRQPRGVCMGAPR